MNDWKAWAYMTLHQNRLWSKLLTIDEVAHDRMLWFNKIVSQNDKQFSSNAEALEAL